MDADTEDDFRAYVAARSAALLRTAYLMTGHRQDAEDLLQVTLAKAYLAWGRIRDRGAADAYVRRTMVNARTSRWRRTRLSEHPVEVLPEPAPGPAETDRHDLHGALWQALADLPPRQRVAVVLRYYEGLTEPETAAVMGISVGTVKSTVSKALTRLRDHRGLCEQPDTAHDVSGALR